VNQFRYYEQSTQVPRILHDILLDINAFAYSVERSLAICKPFLQFKYAFLHNCPEANISSLHIFQYRLIVSALSEEDEKNDWNFMSV